LRRTLPSPLLTRASPCSLELNLRQSLLPKTKTLIQWERTKASDLLMSSNKEADMTRPEEAEVALREATIEEAVVAVEAEANARKERLLKKARTKPLDRSSKLARRAEEEAVVETDLRATTRLLVKLKKQETKMSTALRLLLTVVVAEAIATAITVVDASPTKVATKLRVMKATNRKSPTSNMKPTKKVAKRAREVAVTTEVETTTGAEVARVEEETDPTLHLRVLAALEKALLGVAEAEARQVLPPLRANRRPTDWYTERWTKKMPPKRMLKAKLLCKSKPVTSLEQLLTKRRAVLPLPSSATNLLPLGEKTTDQHN